MRPVGGRCSLLFSFCAFRGSCASLHAVLGNFLGRDVPVILIGLSIGPGMTEPLSAGPVD